MTPMKTLKVYCKSSADAPFETLRINITDWDTQVIGENSYLVAYLGDIETHQFDLSIVASWHVVDRNEMWSGDGPLTFEDL